MEERLLARRNKIGLCMSNQCRNYLDFTMTAIIRFIFLEVKERIQLRVKMQMQINITTLRSIPTIMQLTEKRSSNRWIALKEKYLSAKLL